MKKLLLPLALVLIAAIASAGSYTINTNAMNDTQKNAVCTLLGLPNGCEAWSR